MKSVCKTWNLRVGFRDYDWNLESRVQGIGFKGVRFRIQGFRV